ncbi:MAG: succinyl-diaminopimelate desuccinylase [Acidimicrobiia bacterium]|nr:succinyl-diaminopimelate desuccinylase [Acidimicrobiia bacterium]NNL13954.1 succinyl-diaminopimelate desuccinylase [Acidimicrobiia bacterium]NNL98717.1 succinyl-diaminopimelate desuccinylase [Acidimicrobiia bacterium]
MTLAETLAWLVDIPSETGHEGRIATAIAERLLPIYGPQGVERIGNSLVVGHRGGKPLISLYGHTDTVPSQGQGPAVVVDGRMHGLGTSDMKGGVAVMLHLLEDEAVRSSAFDVIGVFYAAEEGPQEGNELASVFEHAAWLDESELGIILEPTNMNLELGCQGVINARVSFVGTSAHSARPWLGENAITKAGPWLQGMGERAPEPVVINGLEFKEVMTVTRAQGGIANNIIPGSFECNVNYRFAPDKTVEEAEAKLAAALAGVDEYEIVDSAPAARVEAANHHVERLAALTGAEEHPKQGWTDAARLSERNIPAINYGPGEVAKAHKVDESVPLENLDAAFGFLKEFFTAG